MGTFSMGHWLIVLAIVVLLFGAKKIPELAKGVGKGIKSFKKEMEDETPAEQITEHKKDNTDTTTNTNTEAKA